MELKRFQSKVIKDLDSYLSFWQITNSPADAYRMYWENKEVRVGTGRGDMRPYNNQLGTAPHICFKVPTGGGKTFLACCSIKHIFDNFMQKKSKVVVWLVPSDAILEQTLKNLKNPAHPYREKLDSNWNGRVEVFSKKELLEGTNFNSTSVKEQLSILVLSFDTFRAQDKETRKIYQANSNLVSFTSEYSSNEEMLSICDPTSLMQVIHHLNPIVIVDESHNATSDLSVEMLKNINPALVLDLTATPRQNSNIITFVSAKDLKRENMVKLPVVVYNRKNQQDVIVNAIDLRNKLEKDAKIEFASSGKYIRPIVLFQAQPRNEEDNTTFDRLKQKLITAGIPENEIAIKTSTINELKDVDLLSDDCQIRYIITVNALKEGWDCPFAYILASLANRSSSVDVEQILGRVLRLPNTSKSSSNFLNMSYVFTSSDDFRETLDNIVEGLNNAGFTKRDCLATPEPVVVDTNTEEEYQEVNIFEQNEDDDIPFNPEEVKETIENDSGLTENGTIDSNENLNNILDSANTANVEYEQASEEENSLFNNEEYEHMDIFNIKSSYLNEIRDLKLPQFYLETEGNLFFGDSQTLLTREMCTEGFKLVGQPLPTGLGAVSDDVYQVDVETAEDGSMVSKYTRMNRDAIETFKSVLERIKPEFRLNACKRLIISRIDQYENSISTSDLTEYVETIVRNMSSDEIDSLEANIFSICEKIKKHIKVLIEKYRYENFFKMIDLNKVVVKNTYEFPMQINPMDHTNRIQSSLYEEEQGSINDSEFTVVNRMVSCGIKWWHRIIAKKDNEFKINAFINHYPDFVVCTKKGTIVLIEVKGEDRDGTDSQQKVKLGRTWQNLSGNSKFKYYMVFLDQAMAEDGAVSLDELAQIVEQI